MSILKKIPCIYIPESFLWWQGLLNVSCYIFPIYGTYGIIFEVLHEAELFSSSHH